ncbi:hypothetical protein HNQ77_004794 [Silvibacterium bohemicum]|uniref:Uncharacterized protein n=1 Tax=Silvibacterium bohemicum TaxID=1577686 RepID=A0A841JZA4_9BACT|nr:hypothetical protein [Silvibacterium bohemicum]
MKGCCRCSIRNIGYPASGSSSHFERLIGNGKSDRLQQFGSGVSRYAAASHRTNGAKVSAYIWSMSALACSRQLRLNLHCQSLRRTRSFYFCRLLPFPTDGRQFLLLPKFPGSAVSRRKAVICSEPSISRFRMHRFVFCQSIYTIPCSAGRPSLAVIWGGVDFASLMGETRSAQLEIASFDSDRHRMSPVICA